MPTRTSHTKSRNGCRTCKARRIRCDQTQPKCYNCSTTGRTCEGFSQERPRPQNVVFKAPLTLTNSRPSELNFVSNDRECHFLELFCKKVTHSASAYSQSEIWTNVIIPAIYQDKAVYHAAISVAAIFNVKHDYHLLGESRPSIDFTTARTFALKNYGLALSLMQAMLFKREESVARLALLCSLLCIWFEVLILGHQQALTHLDSSLKVIKSRSCKDSRIETAFLNLDLQASMYLGTRPPVFFGEVSDDVFLTKFNSLDDAEVALLNEMSQAYHFVRSVADDYRYRKLHSIPFPVLAKAQAIEQRLAHWETIFSDLQKKDISSRLVILEIKHMTAVIVMTTCLYIEETLYDSCLDRFRAIVALSRELLRSHSGIKSSLEMGVIHALYLTAIKCRDPRTRQEAIDLLKRVLWDEGVWSARIVAPIASRVKELEEEGLKPSIAGDVPEFRRVHGVGIENIDYHYRLSTVLLRRRLNGPDGEWDDVTEVIPFGR